MQTGYNNQVQLLLQILPVVMTVKDFALKGGTAINFFWRNFPRLSVDIDLTYVPIKERTESLTDIHNLLSEVKELILQINPSFRIKPMADLKYKLLHGLLVQKENTIVKIEVNTILRGVVQSVVRKELSPEVQSRYGRTLKANTLSFEDLFGGKICAALDRQHPRDLFDIKLLFENEGLTDEIRKVFIVYLISHPRPIAELLDPNLLDINPDWAAEFYGMTSRNISLDELLETRSELIRLIKTSLSDSEKQFLINFKNQEPDWSLLGLDGIENLPAVRWKLHNLALMKRDKHVEALQKLKKVLDNS